MSLLISDARHASTLDECASMLAVPPPWCFARLIWRQVLEIAVRDRASSVHYHPWCNGSPLTYIVAGTRYEIVPPLDYLSRTLVLAAGAMLARTRAGVWSRRFLGWPIRASGLLRLSDNGRVTEWAGIVWAIRGLSGVEWNRVDDAFVAAEPVAAPDPAR
jgi:hypothetical protein